MFNSENYFVHLFIQKSIFFIQMHVIQTTFLQALTSSALRVQCPFVMELYLYFMKNTSFLAKLFVRHGLKRHNLTLFIYFFTYAQNQTGLN